MSIYSIFVVNNYSDCDNLIEEELLVNGCSNYTIYLNPLSKASGPFSIYVNYTGSTPIYSGITRENFLRGINFDLECVTPTPTVSPSVTPTPTVTPTPSLTPSVIQTYYILTEDQNPLLSESGDIIVWFN